MATYSEDFESGSPSGWINGSCVNYTGVGDYGWKSTVGSSQPILDGVKVPSPSTEFSLDIYQGGYVYIGPSYDNSYYFYGGDNSVRIGRKLNGAYTDLAVNDSPSISETGLVTFDITWGANGQIDFIVTGTGGNSESLSVTDTSHTTGGNLFLAYNDILDNYYINDIVSNQSASLDSASLTTSAQPLSATGGAEPTPTGDVTRGLVSRWTLDGNALDQVGTLDPSTVSGVTYTGGHIEQAASFDGSDYIEYPADGSIQTDDFTISAWANVNSTSSGTTAIQTVSAKNLDHTDRQFWLVEWDGSWTCRIGSNGQGVTGSAATPGAWTHLLATYDSATSTFEFWVNGISQGTATESAIGGDGQTFCIGAESPSHRMFNGLIDEVRYYNVVLTASEIADLYAYDGTTVAPVSAGLEAASLAFSPRALSVTPGATGATLGAATTNLASSNVGASCGPVSAGIDAVRITVEAGAVGTTLGVVSLVLASAPLSSTPASLGSTVGPTSAALDSSILIALSRSLGVSEAIYAALESASMVSSSGALGASPGAVSASMPSAALSVVAESPVVALAELAVELDAGSLAVSVRKVTPVAGSVSAGLESASLVLTLPNVEALKALVAALDVASITSVSTDLGAIPGSLSPELDAASAVISASPVDVGVGLRSVGLDVVELVAEIPGISAENVLYLFLRVSEAGNSSFTLDGTGSTGFSVGNSGDNGFELDSDNENSL
jgi:hypothetical protein